MFGTVSQVNQFFRRMQREITVSNPSMESLSCWAARSAALVWLLHNLRYSLAPLSLYPQNQSLCNCPGFEKAVLVAEKGVVVAIVEKNCLANDF
jgi:hypothetical protein